MKCNVENAVIKNRMKAISGLQLKRNGLFGSQYGNILEAGKLPDS